MNKYCFYIGILGLLLAPTAYASIDGVETWAIQRQQIDIDTVAEADHDLVVIEYSPDGTDDNPFTASEVSRMKQNGKKVLAYLSIGKAESYRFYWRSTWEAPRQQDCYETYFDPFHRRFTWRNACPAGNFGLIGEKDPDWDGRHEVRYWEREWWEIAIKPYLERIFAAGFDGVYITGIDAYEYWGEKEGSTQVVANEMALLAYRVAVTARLRMGEDFLVIPQDGMSIVRDTSPKWRRLYLKAIDAIALESFFFDTTSHEKQRRRSLVKEFFAKGKDVLVLEYTKEKYLPRLRSRIAEFEQKYGIPVSPYRSTNDAGLYRLLPPMKK